MSHMANATQQSLQGHGNQVKKIALPLVLLVLAAWTVEVVDRLFLGGTLDQFGIVPRQAVGLRGISFAPFLHGSFAHLLANSVPFLILGFLIMWRHARRFAVISLVIIVVSGLGTWLIAPSNTVHIGASGLIFGYFAFLVVNAWYERSLAAVALALAVILMYGGLISGIVPTGNPISWQGHLFGMIGGAIAAYYFSDRRN